MFRPDQLQGRLRPTVAESREKKPRLRRALHRHRRTTARVGRVTFERLRAIFHLELEPSVDLLRRLQAGEVDLGGLEAAVQKVVDPHLLAYNDTWDKVDAMLAELMSESFRTQVRDSAGAGWIYNWFCVDHVDYDLNPRRRDMGYHNIFEHYRAADPRDRLIAGWIAFPLSPAFVSP